MTSIFLLGFDVDLQIVLCSSLQHARALKVLTNHYEWHQPEFGSGSTDNSQGNINPMGGSNLY